MSSCWVFLCLLVLFCLCVALFGFVCLSWLSTCVLDMFFLAIKGETVFEPTPLCPDSCIGAPLPRWSVRTHNVKFSLFSKLCFGLKWLMRERFGCLAAKCSFVFTSNSLTLSVCCLVLVRGCILLLFRASKLYSEPQLLSMAVPLVWVYVWMLLAASAMNV